MAWTKNSSKKTTRAVLAFLLFQLTILARQKRCLVIGVLRVMRRPPTISAVAGCEQLSVSGVSRHELHWSNLGPPLLLVCCRGQWRVHLSSKVLLKNNIHLWSSKIICLLHSQDPLIAALQAPQPEPTPWCHLSHTKAGGGGFDFGAHSRTGGLPFPNLHLV